MAPTGSASLRQRRRSRPHAAPLRRGGVRRATRARAGPRRRSPRGRSHPAASRTRRSRSRGTSRGTRGSARRRRREAVGPSRRSRYRERGAGLRGCRGDRANCGTCGRVLLSCDARVFAFAREDMLQVAEIIERVRAYQPSADAELIKRAFDYSYKMHEGQMRKSGDPYIVAPRQRSGHHHRAAPRHRERLRGPPARRRRGHARVVQGHREAVRRGDRELVDGVTKLSKINFTSKEDRQAENFRKMVVAMARDIRVLLVKLCDRVDNMRTLEHMSHEAQERIARETLEIYAPLANRLGMPGFKSELEDLSFKYLEPTGLPELVASVDEEQARARQVHRRGLQDAVVAARRAGVRRRRHGAREAPLLDLAKDEGAASARSTRSTTTSRSACSSRA